VPDAAPKVSIERLSLRVAGLDERAAAELARLVAQRLAPGLLRPAGLAGLDRLELQVQDASVDPDLLARRIVDAIGRELARDRGVGSTGAEALP
jgi:hypothetical protein